MKINDAQWVDLETGQLFTNQVKQAQNAKCYQKMTKLTQFCELSKKSIGELQISKYSIDFIFLDAFMFGITIYFKIHVRLFALLQVPMHLLVFCHA